MKCRKWLSYLIWVMVCLAVGTVSGLLSRQGMVVYNETVIKPLLTPPGFLFPIVWSILYVLMGISGARIWLSEKSPERSKGLKLFAAQLVVNFFWSLIFFNLQLFDLGFLWLLLLWGLVAWMILTFRKVDPLASNLQLPYLLWLTFAAYLSGAVWVLNA